MAKALYVHVPFCNAICAYCDFVRAKYNSVLADKWLLALENEIKGKSMNPDLDTLYLGGGTPSSLSISQLTSLLELLKPYTRNLIEYTIEMNPDSIDYEKLDLLKRYGVNRISLGVQSFNDKLLTLMNRRHDNKKINETLSLIKQFGFSNYSIDLIYSLPTQTKEQWMDSLITCIKLRIPHISLYALTIEAHSEFSRKGYHALDEDCEALMYEIAIEVLVNAGYEHYEISNFSLPGYESIHNQVYWHYEDFYGLGLGASGKENHHRYDNTANFIDYEQGKILENEIFLCHEEEMFEMLMMGLRLKKGISKEVFKKRFNQDIHKVYGAKLTSLIQKGLLCEDEFNLFASATGFRLLNSVLVELM